MGLVPKPSLLLPRNKIAGTSMSESGIQDDELVISSKKPEGMAVLNRASASMHLVPKIFFDSLPLKYTGNMRNSWDKLKRKNKDPTGEYRMEQWIPMRGTPRGTSFSDLCRAGKLSVNCNRSYAACIPKHSGRNQGIAMLTVGCYGKQAKMCILDTRVVPGILCIGVEDVTCCRTDFFRDGEEARDRSAPQNKINLEMPLEFHTLPSGRAKQYDDDDAREPGLPILSKLDLPWQKHPSSSAILSSLDPTHIQSNKSEQHSPVSVLEQLFEDSSPRPEKSTTNPIKPSIQPLHLNFEEQFPAKRVKFHSDTISRFTIPSKKHTSRAAEYTRKVLEASELDWYKLALKWHCSTQMLDPATYTRIESQRFTPLETRVLFDHINEVLLDIYQPYSGFYPWVPLSRPNKPHFVNFIDEVIRIVEMNLILREQQIPREKLVVHYMEKCGTWMDIRRELEDMVLEIVQEIEEELVDEFVFELWID